MAALLKNALEEKTIVRLTKNIERAHESFDVENFVNACLKGLNELELKERVAHIATKLKTFLPEKYEEALSILVKSKLTWDAGDDDDSMGSFAAWPLFHFIEKYGVEHFSISMNALKVLTPLFSAEFAVRPFIARWPKRSFAELEKWVDDDDEHVRRLVSEGIRPRLPWASKVQLLLEEPAPILELIEKLKDDSALYVRRSVANNLNDIAKDHADVVIDLCERWLVDADENRKWIVKHATRTLVKQGHERIWGLLGFTQKVEVAVSPLLVDKEQVQFGESLQFCTKLKSTSAKSQRLAVDFAVHYMKANGKQKPKVFKLKVLDLKAQEVFLVEKGISFKEISTRKYYAGAHAIELLVNGKALARVEFDLE